MYGVTENGNSVMCHIHNFLSYFYVQINYNYQKDPPTPEEIESIKIQVNKKLSKGSEPEHAVSEIQVVKKASVMGYQESLDYFLKIYMFLPSYIAASRQLFEK